MPSLLEHNPFAWFIEIDGMIMDARNLPPEIQEGAFQEGLIPSVPGGEARSGLVARYRRLRKISTEHQTVLAKRAIEESVADITLRIGLIRDAGEIASMDFEDLVPASRNIVISVMKTIVRQLDAYRTGG